jgi:hypothetical protein
MKKLKLSNINSLLILLTMLLISCGPKTIEQQVEIVMKSDDEEERQTLSYALADSLSIKADELFLGLHQNPIANEALKNILTRYSEIIIINPSETERALECIRYITEPNLNGPDNLNEDKIKLIIHALQINNLDEKYETTLISAAKQHGKTAMIKIIDSWHNNKNSVSVINAIKAFDDKAITYLVNIMETDTVAVDLLARFGKPIVQTMIEKMKDREQSVRFAAGDVLVQMQKYDPSAIAILTSAIDNGGVNIIAKNYPFYLRLGDYNTVDNLLKALDLNFDQNMCVDYLNCGNSILEKGASDIAAKHGYMVTSSVGSHSGPKWGSGN